MNRTAWLYSERFLDHDTGPAHPERPDRLRAILAGMAAAGLQQKVIALPFSAADDETLLLNHHDAYIERVELTCAADGRFIDTPDSMICPQTAEIARLAVGAGVAACDAIMGGRVDNAFCAVRPPGHHARANRSAGFCIFNNIAIAARHLLRRHGLSRVAILDWDVHHGDGTQESFEPDEAVLFCSLHEDPRHCYPGTGYASERGRGRGEGCTFNVPLPTGTTDEPYMEAFERIVEPAVRAFRPEFVLVSNGLDAHMADPLADLSLSDACYSWLMRRACDLAQASCAGRLVVFLEGGYDLGVLSRCVSEQVAVMLASPAPLPPSPDRRVS